MKGHSPLKDVEVAKRFNIMRWILYVTFGGVTLAIAANVNDSTIFKPVILNIGIVILIASGIDYLVSRKEIIIRLTAIHFALAGMFIGALLSLFKAHNINLALEALFHQLSFIIIFLYSARLFSESQQQKKLFFVFAVILFITCIVGIPQALNLLPEQLTIFASGRDTISTLGNATYFGGFLVMMTPLVFGLMFIESQKRKKILYGVFCLLLVFLLIKTESRGAWIAFTCSIILFSFLYFTTRKIRWIAFTGIIVTMILTAVIFPDIVQKRVESLFSSDPSSSAVRRIHFYKGAWNAFLSSPVIGNGAGNFIIFLPHFRSNEYWISGSEDIVPHAHNEYLEILSETGIAGFASFALVLLLCFLSIRKRLASTSNVTRIVLISCLSSIAAVLIDNTVNLSLRTLPVTVGFWVLLGVSYGAVHKEYKTISFPFPSFMINLRIIPYILAIIFLFWYVPVVGNHIMAEKKLIEGNLYMRSGEEYSATRKFEESLSYDSTNSLARFYLAANTIKENRFTDAKRHALTLLRDFPYYPKAHLILALSAFELGDTVEAFRAVQEEIRLENFPQAYYYYSYFASRSGKKDLQYELLVTMVEQNIKSKTRAYADIGITLLSELSSDAESKNKLLNLFARAEETFPSDSNVQIALVEGYINMNQRDKASIVLSRVKTLPPEGENAEKIKNLESLLSANSEPDSLK